MEEFLTQVLQLAADMDAPKAVLTAVTGATALTALGLAGWVSKKTLLGMLVAVRSFKAWRAARNAPDSLYTAICNAIDSKLAVKVDKGVLRCGTLTISRPYEGGFRALLTTMGQEDDVTHLITRSRERKDITRRLCARLDAIQAAEDKAMHQLATEQITLATTHPVKAKRA